MKEDQHYIISLIEELLGETCLREHTFETLRGDSSSKYPMGKKLPVDGYFPNHNLIVEYYESQHTKPNTFMDKPDVMTVSGVSRGIQRRMYDIRRVGWAKANGVHLLIVDYSEFENKRGKIVRNHNDDIQKLESSLKRLLAQTI